MEAKLECSSPHINSPFGVNCIFHTYNIIVYQEYTLNLEWCVINLTMNCKLKIHRNDSYFVSTNTGRAYLQNFILPSPGKYSISVSVCNAPAVINLKIQIDLVSMIIAMCLSLLFLT